MESIKRAGAKTTTVEWPLAGDCCELHFLRNRQKLGRAKNYFRHNKAYTHQRLKIQRGVRLEAVQAFRKIGGDR